MSRRGRKSSRCRKERGTVLGLTQQAIPLQEKVRDYHLKTNGSEHPDTLSAMADLAYVYDTAGRQDEALKLREEVLALRRKVLGPEHPHTLLAMTDLALSYSDAGEEKMNPPQDKQTPAPRPQGGAC
jgi:hypothetical protein